MAAAAVVDVANLCLESDNRNEVIYSKDVVVNAMDVITLLGKAEPPNDLRKKGKIGKCFGGGL